MQEIVKTFKALSDGSRLRIYKMLSTKELCVCEITSILELALSTVSSHLKILKEAGLIEEFKTGKWVNYRLKNDLQPTIINKIKLLLDSVNADQFDFDKNRVLQVDRNIICSK